MRHFFMKKYIFAACFLLLLGSFSAYNMYFERDALEKLGSEFLEIKSIQDVKAWVSEVEAKTADKIAGKMQFIELYGYANKLMGKQELEMFRYVKGVDGLTHYGTTWSKMSDTSKYVTRVRKLKEYAEEHGMKVLFVSAPANIIEGVTQQESYSLLNDPNPLQDQFLWQLQQNRVPALDLRKPLRESGMKAEEMFFRSDHHWTAPAAFIATQALVEEVRQRYGDDWDPEGYYCDISNYNSVTYPSSELGSIARNAGAVYAGVDDFTLLWPQFETSFYWKAYDRYGETDVYEGDITESLLRIDYLGDPDIYKIDPYPVYINAVNTTDEIINYNNPEGPSLLVLRDSYFAPMACFLAPMCSRMDMVWNEASGDLLDFGQYLKEHVESGEYDYLIVELYPYSLDSETSFPYFIEESE